MIRYVRSKTPVVRTVFKQVSNRHRRVRETVNENRLQQSLSIVEGVASGSNAANLIRIIFITTD